MNKDLNDALVELREEDALRIVKVMIQSGENPSDLVEACKNAVKGVEICKKWVGT